QYMNLFGIKQYLIALFPLAIIVLVFPMALPGANFTTAQALLVALISAAMYGVFLLIQTKTHQSLFIYEHEDEGDDDDPHHGKPSAHSNMWHAAWLIIHLIAVIAVTKMNASPLETLLTELNAPVAFTGFLVALLILSPEGLGALKAVLSNQVQRAMNLFFGSVLATISLTVPVVTLIAWATGNDLVFALGAPEMIVMVSSLVLCHISFSTGRTNVLNGAAHLALFIAYLMTIFA
ncbi:TPA: sodium-potassium/proton antiporter ChaA, partial [Citrobacter freundii]|nr:sodium-potassium/proton antiporter ChaA [Citrobacter freundii]